ncbi:predicted protein [Plenodomus lingam JN3]|uniref:Predicted protein n=2 Tax=Leptosphaeria maculans TaxID=5022 RepID=E4ZX99_LEPMJ|nr:predicted protein [Plenodomus lingam JN3]CBX95309.1 predicted protein [Plenodomus lingam JN3]
MGFLERLQPFESCLNLVSEAHTTMTHLFVGSSQSFLLSWRPLCKYHGAWPLQTHRDLWPPTRFAEAQSVRNMGWKILDCAESTPDCAARNQAVEANLDIAGIGVIIAFLCATCLAFMIAFAVIFLDRYENIVDFFRRRLSKQEDVYKNDYTGPRYWRSPAFWSRVLSKNLLAFSDTQLLTGLAIQFTAMLKHCQISVYHFRIVTELAFLTTVTHLLTVIALRNYFVKNRWINLPRIFFMLGNLALLGYTSFVAYSYDLVEVDVSQSLACFFKSERPPFTAAFGGKWAALLVGAIGGHATIILAMYWLDDPNKSRTLTQKTVADKKHQRKTWWYHVGATIRTWIVAPVYSIYGIWMAGDGLRHTQALGRANVDIRGDERDWGFGQFLPVLLLALPLFAGWESFWEEKDEDRDTYFGHCKRPSRCGSEEQPRESGVELLRSAGDGSVGGKTSCFAVSALESDCDASGDAMRCDSRPNTHEGQVSDPQQASMQSGRARACQRLGGSNEVGVGVVCWTRWERERHPDFSPFAVRCEELVGVLLKW